MSAIAFHLPGPAIAAPSTYPATEAVSGEDSPSPSMGMFHAGERVLFYHNSLRRNGTVIEMFWSDGFMFDNKVQVRDDGGFELCLRESEYGQHRITADEGGAGPMPAWRERESLYRNPNHWCNHDSGMCACKSPILRLAETTQEAWELMFFNKHGKWPCSIRQSWWSDLDAPSSPVYAPSDYSPTSP